MVKTIILTLVSTAILSGCIAYKPVKIAVDEVCESSDVRKAVLAEEFDKATFPHKLRVQCAEPNGYTQVTGDVE